MQPRISESFWGTWAKFEMNLDITFYFVLFGGLLQTIGAVCFQSASGICFESLGLLEPEARKVHAKCCDPKLFNLRSVVSEPQPDLNT